MNPSILPIIVFALATALIIAIYLFMRMNQRRDTVVQPTQLSHLVCPNCGLQFDYAWIPFSTFTSIKWFNSRIFPCPRCGQSSSFNIWDTRVDPETHHCEVRVGPS